MNLNLTKILLQMRFKSSNSGSPINYTPDGTTHIFANSSKLDFLKKKIQKIYKSGSNDIKFPANLGSDPNGSWFSKGSDPVGLFHRKKFLIALFSLIFISIPVALISLQSAKKAVATWFDDSWLYRQTVPITNAGTAQTDYQIAITLDTATLITAGKMQADCDDIRITDINGKLLPHWVETGTNACNTATTAIWTKVPSISTSGATAYLYYGNPSATNVQNGNNVFNFFDDFNGDLTKWNTPSCGSMSISSGVLQWTGSGTGHCYVTPTTTYNPTLTDMATESRTRYLTGSAGTLYWGVNTRASGTTRYVGALYASNNVCDVRTNTSTVLNAACTTSVDTWYIDTLRNYSTTLKMYQNRVEKVSTTNGSYSSGGVGLDFYHASAPNSATYEFDWIFARKTTATEPTIGSPTNEEQSQGPVAYWKFDEGYGSTANDSTTNANNGSLGVGTSAPTWTSEDQCISGKCLKFDANDYITSSQYPSFSSSLTYNVWIKRTNTTGQQGLISMNRTMLQITDSQIDWYPDIDITVISQSTTLNVGEWYMITVTQTGTTYNIYKNGISIKSGTTTALDSTNSNKYIGTYTPGARHFGGFMDDVKIYPYARTAAQIKSDYISHGSVKGTSVQMGSSSSNSDALSNGLVGYWKMDEASQNSCGSSNDNCDASGNGVNGDWTGTFTSTSGKFGNASTFVDGAANYIDLGDNSLYDFGSNDFTVGVWAKRTSVGAWDSTLVTKWNTGASPSTNEWSLSAGSSVDNLLPSFSIESGSTPYSTASTEDMSLNAWHHVVGMRKGDYIYIFVDGVEKNKTYIGNISVNNVAGRTVKIAKIDGGSYGFIGSIDEARIYNRALSPREVRDLYNYAPGPLGYWNMDEGTGTNLYDRSGNGNNSTSFAGSPSWVSGKFGKALEFNGTNGRVSIPSISATYGENPVFTAEFWVKPGVNAYGWYKGILGTNSSAWNVMYLYSATNFRYNTHHSTDLGASYSWTIVNKGNSWQHFAITFDKPNNQAILYQDGINMGTLAISKRITGSFSYIGGQTGAAEYFNGAIDDVRIYNYIRTPGQIVQDMNAGHPLGGSPVGSQIAYYKFDEGYGTTINNIGVGGTALNGSLGVGTSAPTWSNSGKFNKALSFDGGDYSLLPGSSLDSLATSGDFTITAWNYQAAFSGIETIIAQAYGFHSNGRWQVGTSGSKGFVSLYGGGSSPTYKQITGIINLTTSTWNHITAVYSRTDSKIKLYINGKFDSETTWDGYIEGVQANKVNLGYNAGTVSQYMNGLIDEVKIYNAALTADEILLDYNHGSAMVLGSTSTTSAGAADNSSAGEYCVPGSSDSCSAPIGEWKMDEKTGGYAYDTSGNGNTGTWNGTGTHWATGKVGATGQFNGSNDYLSVGTNLGLSGDFSGTISTWVKRTSGTDFQSVIVAGSAVAMQSFSIGINGNGEGSFSAEFNGGNGRKSAAGLIPLNTWVFLTVVKTPGPIESTTKLYLNGAEVAQVAGQTGTPNFVANLGYIGTWTNLAYYFNGQIDQVRIYNYARTPAQIAWDYNRGAPVGHWKLDECQGITANDASGNGNNGTITIGATGTNTSAGTCTGSAGQAWKDGATGKYNSSLEFDGTDDLISNGSSAFNIVYPAFSISTWFKTTDATPATSKTIVSKGTNGGDNEFNLNLETDGRVRFWYGTGNGNGGVFTTSYAQDNTWHNVVGIWDGTNQKVYIDGILGSSNAASSTTSTNDPVLIGSWNQTANWWFPGQIDDVRIYNYALTPTQIKTLFNENSSVRFGE